MNDCNAVVHLQIFRGDPSKWYTDQDLADMWNICPVTVRVWKHRALKHGHPPRPGQTRIIRKNAARRWSETRADYANLLEAIFKAKTIRL